MIEIISSISRKEKERDHPSKLGMLDPPLSIDCVSSPKYRVCQRRRRVSLCFLVSSLSGGRKTDVRAADEQLDDQEKRGKNEIVLANLFLFLFFLYKFQREWKYIVFFSIHER